MTISTPVAVGVGFAAGVATGVAVDRLVVPKVQNAWANRAKALEAQQNVSEVPQVEAAPQQAIPANVQVEMPVPQAVPAQVAIPVQAQPVPTPAPQAVTG